MLEEVLHCVEGNVTIIVSPKTSSCGTTPCGGGREREREVKSKSPINCS